MPRPTFAIAVENAGPVGQDRATVIEAGGSLILAVADGAGGTSHGDRAADLVIRHLEEHVARGEDLDDEGSWAAFLAEVDRTIALDPFPGETTAVVLATTS